MNMNRYQFVHWVMLAVILITAPGVSCVTAVAREAQFGALDGVNSFVADGVRAFLVSVVPFLSPAE